MNKILVCLGAGKNQLPIIKHAKNRGYSILAIDQNINASGFSLADIKIIKSTYNTSEVLAELQSSPYSKHFKGIIARTSGPALNTAASIAKKFHLPGLNKEIVQLATEKSKLRKFCFKHGLKIPNGTRVNSEQNIDLNIPFPIIIKPDLPLVGKKDIKVIKENVSDLNIAIHNACLSSGNLVAEIEEYVEGIDVSVLFYMNMGKATVLTYWDELIGLDTKLNIIGLGISVPSVIVGTEVEKNIEEIVLKFANLFRDVKSIMILSFKVDTYSKLHIIELHADLGGDLIADKLLPKANLDFDFFDMALRIATNQEIGIIDFELSPVSLLFNFNQYPKKLTHTFETFEGHFFISTESLDKNLEIQNKLFQSLNLAIQPLHNNWRQNNKTNKRI